MVGPQPRAGLLERPVNVRQVRLTSSLFLVDVRLVCLDGKWLASADSIGGPTLGTGTLALEALTQALAPFEGIIDELLASAPLPLLWARG